MEDDPLIYVRRQYNDWRTGGFRLSKLSGFHMDNTSGGVRATANRFYLHAYAMCTDMEEGEIGHSCQHGPPPHRIKVCITKTDNKDTYKLIPTSD